MSTGTTQQRDMLEERRRVLDPSKVDLHHMPNFFRRRLLKAYGCVHGITSGNAVLEHAQALNGWTWLDHHGSTSWRGRQAFVSEPYHLTNEEHQQVAEMCERCGLEHHIDATSSWFPGWTIRILVYEPEVE